jgi:hypothetical protein
MRIILAAIAVVIMASSSFAAEFAKGATRNVKPNSIWFQDADELAQWQSLKRGGDAAAFSAYEEKMLSSREAWQFIPQLSVKVLSYDSKRKQVSVEMLTPGRLQGEDWVLDAGSFAP